MRASRIAKLCVIAVASCMMAVAADELADVAYGANKVTLADTMEAVYAKGTPAAIAQAKAAIKAAYLASVGKLDKIANSRGVPAKAIAAVATDPGAPARCTEVLNGVGPGNKKCTFGNYGQGKYKGKRPRSKNMYCPDGIGYAGVYHWFNHKGGMCLAWDKADGKLVCEKHTCYGHDGKNADACPQGKGYKFYRKNKGWKGKACRYTFLKDTPTRRRNRKGKKYCYGGTTPYKKAPQVCVKTITKHVDEQSRSVGVLIVKRTSCSGKVCSTYKMGKCIDLKKNVWSSAFNSHHHIKSIGLNMAKERKAFAKAAVALLKKYKNNLPKEHQCSDTRHKFMYQSADGQGNKWKRHISHIHKDSTLSKLAILHF